MNSNISWQTPGKDTNEYLDGTRQVLSKSRDLAETQQKHTNFFRACDPISPAPSFFTTGSDQSGRKTGDISRKSVEMGRVQLFMMGVLANHPSLQDDYRIFHDKPSILGYPHDYGTPLLMMIADQKATEPVENLVLLPKNMQGIRSR